MSLNIRQLMEIWESARRAYLNSKTIGSPADEFAKFQAETAEREIKQRGLGAIEGHFLAGCIEYLGSSHEKRCRMMEHLQNVRCTFLQGSVFRDINFTDFHIREMLADLSTIKCGVYSAR